MIDWLFVGQLLGFLSFGLGMATFYQKDDKQLKILMVVFNINHLIHYFLLGSLVSVVASALSASRTLASIFTQSRLVAWAFIVVAVVFGLFVSEGAIHIWPILGTAIGTYCVFMLKGIEMRVGFLIGATCWLINNIIVGSIGGTLLEATLIVTNSVTIYRMYIDDKMVVSQTQSSQ
ncbi:YgjV family protein [Vibrio hangzhouensis]|uniref:Inner membrane protein n=1 Tax=Vibrio hangzhouensis TaxID=462991 RepID=A0A1H5TQ93_9VIBR|nr:YgjV family protein [Vibrio hangzhouensis]SEF64965.1 inner membrane protein [Vibrio hangzhouensis]